MMSERLVVFQLATDEYAIRILRSKNTGTIFIQYGPDHWRLIMGMLFGKRTFFIDLDNYFPPAGTGRSVCK